MNTLLIFFAFPVAVIIISAILQKLLNNPAAIAAIIFAIFIVVTFAVFDETFLIEALAYTILAFLTAILVDRLCNSNNFCNLTNRNANCTTCLCNALNQALENNNENTNNVIQGLLDLLRNNESNSNDTDDDNVIDDNSTCPNRKRCRRF